MTSYFQLYPPERSISGFLSPSQSWECHSARPSSVRYHYTCALFLPLSTTMPGLHIKPSHGDDEYLQLSYSAGLLACLRDGCLWLVIGSFPHDKAQAKTRRRSCSACCASSKTGVLRALPWAMLWLLRRHRGAMAEETPGCICMYCMYIRAFMGKMLALMCCIVLCLATLPLTSCEWMPRIPGPGPLF